MRKRTTVPGKEEQRLHQPSTAARKVSRGSLRRHLMNRLVLVLLAALVLSVLVILLWVRPSLVKTQMDRNRWHAYYIAQALDSQLGKNSESVKAAAITLDVLHEVHEDLKPEETRSVLQGMVANENALENLMILDLAGVVLHAPPEEQSYEGLDLSRSPWFKTDLPENQIVWSAIQFSALSSRPETVCVLRKDQFLYVGFVRLRDVDRLVHQMRMPDGTHVHVLDQDNRTVVGHEIEETFTQSYAPHLPEEGFAEAEGSYTLFDGTDHYFAEYFRMTSSDWVVAVMTTQKSVWSTTWVFLGGVSGMLFAVIAALMLLIWQANRTWMREFAAIERLLHRIASHEATYTRLEEEAQVVSEKVDADPVDERLPAAIRPKTALKMIWKSIDRDPALRFTDFDSLICDFTFLLDTAHIAEEEAREKALEAERAEQAKNRFIGNISQEIRNPLGGILGASDLLLFRETDPEKRERLRLLRQSAELLGRTMEDVLDIANLESGRFQLADEELQIHRLLEDLVQQYAGVADKKGLQLNLRWDRSLPLRLRGDGTRIRQILSNLLSNAVKFTEEGIVRVSSQLEGTEGTVVTVRFSVRDTGMGIPPDEIEQIFWEFHQGDNGKGNRRPNGVGLGLAVCRRLVAAMGGKIGVESEVGQGSHFWVSLPLHLTQGGAGDDETNA